MNPTGSPAHISADVSADISRMYQRGLSPKAIGALLGYNGRKIQSHIYWKRLTPDQREAKRIKDRERRPNRTFEKRLPGRQRKVETLVIPADVIAERNARFTRGFDIRWDVLGEPEPGRSALDRKLAEMRT